jgi:hypothetical protein
MKKSISGKKLQTIEGVLFLEGVYINECFTLLDPLNEKFLEQKHDNFLGYDKIPATFENADSFIKSTNLHCWNCTRQFKNRPYFEPTSITPTTYKKFSLGVNGIFCSPFCGRRHINNYTKDLAERKNKVTMLKILYEMYTGRNIDDIPMAPMHTELVQFGGNLTNSQYQDIINKLYLNLYKEDKKNIEFNDHNDSVDIMSILN